MSEFFAELQADPVDVIFLQCEADEERIQVNLLEILNKQLGIDFDLRDIAKNGQIALLDKSEKFGALFFSFASYLVVVRNDQLHNLVNTGQLPPQEQLTTINMKENQPISFLKVCDIVDKVFIQREDGGLKMVKTEVLLQKNAKSAQQLFDNNVQTLFQRGDENTGGKVRQMCTSQSKLATLILENDDKPHKLFLLDLDKGSVLGSKENVNSAVFNAAQDAIIAGMDTTEDGLVVLKADGSLAELTTINLTFPKLNDDIEIDKYRLFWIEQPFKNNFIMFAACYPDQDSLDDNLGMTLMIWVGDDIKQGTSLEGLKAAKKVKTFFWDLHHQDDNIIPSFSIQWLCNSNDPSYLLGVAQMNHNDQPYCFSIENGNFAKCYEFSDLSKVPLLSRPNAVDSEDPMDAVETLGACLGMKILSSVVAGAPSTFEIRLRGPKEELETLKIPPTLYMYSLNGMLSMYHVFYAPWKDKDILHQVRVPQEIACAAQGGIQLGNEDKMMKERQKQLLIMKQEQDRLRKQKENDELKKKESLLKQLEEEKNRKKQEEDARLKQIEVQRQEKERNAQRKDDLISPQDQKLASKNESWQMPKPFSMQPPAQQPRPMNPLFSSQPSKPLGFNTGQEQMMQNQVQRSMPPMQPMQKQVIQPIQQPPRPMTPQEIRADIVSKWSAEQKMAFQLDNAITDVYNEHVVSKMNNLQKKFPPNLQKDEVIKQNLAEFVEQQKKNQGYEQAIKALIKETEQSQISVKSQLNVTDRLKREVQYGINGDATVSKTSISDMARLNDTVNEFIKNSEEYEEEDKDLLRDIFRNGNQLVHQFDQMLRRVKFQEKLLQAHNSNLNSYLSTEEKSRRTESGPNQIKPALFSQAPSQSNDDKFRNNLLRHSGCLRPERNIQKISSQVYLQENIKHVEREIADINALFQQLQKAGIISAERLMKKEEAKAAVLKTSGKLSFNDEDEYATQQTPRQVQENEHKAAEEYVHKKENMRKVIRDRARNKGFQKQLMSQFKEAKQATIIVVNLDNSQEKQHQRTQAIQPEMQSKSVAAFTKQVDTIKQSQDKKQDANVAKFFEQLADPKQQMNERNDRKEFISSLDKTLISSPCQSPKPSKGISVLNMQTMKNNAQMNLGASMIDQSANVKQQNSNGMPLRQDSKGYSKLSFGTDSDALQTQTSLCKPKTQTSIVSFGEKQLSQVAEQLEESKQKDLGYEDSEFEGSEDRDKLELLTSLKKKGLFESEENKATLPSQANDENSDLSRTKTQSFGKSAQRSIQPLINVSKLKPDQQQESLQTQETKPLGLFGSDKKKSDDTLDLLSESKKSAGQATTGLFGASKKPEAQPKQASSLVGGEAKKPDEVKPTTSILAGPKPPQAEKQLFAGFGQPQAPSAEKKAEAGIPLVQGFKSTFGQPGSGMGSNTLFAQPPKPQAFGSMDLNQMAKQGGTGNTASQPKFGAFASQQLSGQVSFSSGGAPAQPQGLSQAPQPQPTSFSQGGGSQPGGGYKLAFGNPSAPQQQQFSMPGQAAQPGMFSGGMNPQSQPGGGMFSQQQTQPMFGQGGGAPPMQTTQNNFNSGSAFGGASGGSIFGGGSSGGNAPATNWGNKPRK